MLIIEICKEYGWDYYTYLSQPNWFLTMIIEKMRIDAKKAKEEELKAKNKR